MCGAQQRVSKVQPLHLKSVCEKHTLHKTDVRFAAAFISLSAPLVCLSSQFVHLSGLHSSCLAKASKPHWPCAAGREALPELPDLQIN